MEMDVKHAHIDGGQTQNTSMWTHPLIFTILSRDLRSRMQTKEKLVIKIMH